MKRSKLYIAILFLLASPAWASFDFDSIERRLGSVIGELEGPGCGGLQANACITDQDTIPLLEHLAYGQNAFSHAHSINRLVNLYKQRRGHGIIHPLILNLEAAVLRALPLPPVINPSYPAPAFPPLGQAFNQFPYANNAFQHQPSYPQPQQPLQLPPQLPPQLPTGSFASAPIFHNNEFPITHHLDRTDRRWSNCQILTMIVAILYMGTWAVGS